MTAPALRTGAAVGSTMTLEQRLLREQSTLRVRAMLVVGLTVLAIVSVCLALGAMTLGSGRWMTLPRVMPVLVWLLAAVAAALAVMWLRGRDANLMSLRALAATVEDEMQLRSGSLRGALEVGRQGVLGARAAQDVARRLTPGVLAPQLAQKLARALAAAAVFALLAVAALVVSARGSRDGFAAVMHPIMAWRGLLLPPLAFDRLPASVPRGMPLTVRIVATGRQTVVVSRRAAGEAWRDTTLRVPENDGGFTALALGPVRAPVTVRVSDGRAPEVEATIAVADRGWIGDVALYATYPTYLQRVNETIEPVPPIRVPRGTRVRISASLRGGARDAYLTNGIDTARFVGDSAVSAEITLDRDSKWVWIASTTSRDGESTLPTEVPDELAFTVVPDRSPDIVIRAPLTDTAIGARGTVPIIVQAGDDHGIANVALQVWRESTSANAADNATAKRMRERIEIADPAEPFFLGGATVVLDGRNLEPGDKLHVVAVATDDSPWRQQTLSPEVILRVPSLTEQRTMARALADSLASRASQMAQQEKRLQQNTEDAARSRELKAGGNQANSQTNGGAKQQGKEGQMSFSQAEKAKQLGRDQQQLGAKVDSLRNSAKELEDRLRNAGALDTALQSRMRDVQRLLREAMSPEMQKQLAALEKSTERLSGTEAQQSMQQLAAQQQQMRQQLEKSAEMLKRAALEGAMSTLRDDANDLAKAERQLADRMDANKQNGAGDKTGNKPGAPKPGEKGAPDGREMTPKELADQSRQLEKEIERLSKRLEEAGAKPGASKTKAAQPMANQAADAMQKAAEQAAEQAAEEAANESGTQQTAQQKAQQNAPQSAQQKNGQQDVEQKNGQPGEQGKPGDPNAAQRGQQAAKPGEKGTEDPTAKGAPQAGKQGQPQPGGQKGESKDGPSGSEQGQSRDGPQGKPGGGQGGGAGAGEARKAADAMDRAARQLASARESQVDAWKTELSQELDQSINETMQLARQQAELEQKARQQGGTQGMQGEQGALQQGVQQAAERLEKAGRSSSLLSQRSQKAMADAQRRVGNATQQMSNSSQPGGSEASQSAMKDATDALNQALSSLVRDREKINNAQSASGFTEMMEQLKQLAQQQGALNGQMQGLNMMPGGAQGEAARKQARALARQQREVAKTLADVSDADQTGRTDALAKEAQTLAQQIERSGIDPNVAARQQQLYRRLLDAGRFLERDERDDQGPREAKAGGAGGARTGVDGPQSGKAATKFAPPTWNELRGLGADERRLVIEYFRRLNGSTP